MEKKLQIILFGQMALFALVSQSVQAADFNAFAGAAIGQNYFSSFAPTSGLGFGTQVTAGIGGLVGVEFGVLYVGETSSYGTGSSTNSITQNFLDVPVMLRISPNQYVSFLGGVFYGWGIGTDHSFASGGGVTTSTSAAKHDYGQIGGMSLQWPFQNNMKIRLESTYQHGEANISNASYVEHSRVLTFWIGGQFPFDWKFLRPSAR